MKKPYKDIDNLNLEMDKIIDDFKIINNHMVAIGMDYKYYMDSSFTDDKIYEYRDNILYRLNATKLHVNILTNLLSSLDEELTSIYSQENGGMKIHFHFDNRINDISALFDSVIFHIISAFDYVSNLIVYITLKEDKNFKWNNLARSVRGDNKLSKANFTNLINELDRTFVCQLYKHRSNLIHFRKNKNRASLKINFMQVKVETKIISASTFNRHFKELRELSKDFDLSISYVLIWLLKTTTNSIIDIQYGIKEYMEQNKMIDNPTIFMKGDKGEFLPPSLNYWERNN